MKVKVHSNIWKIILFTGLVLLIVFRFDEFKVFLRSVFTASIPILIGLVLAFILNILMVKFEVYIFRKARIKKL